MFRDQRWMIEGVGSEGFEENNYYSLEVEPSATIWMKTKG
jgi:hypothetical protein